MSLKWSEDKRGNRNGKKGPYTLFVVSFYAERGYFVAPKLPGLKTMDVSSPEHGQRVAEKLFQDYLEVLNEKPR